MPDIEWAQVPHPLGSLGPDELHAIAGSALEQFVEIVVESH